MIDLNVLHDHVAAMVDRASARGEYPRHPADIHASRQMLETALAARENSLSDP